MEINILKWIHTNLHGSAIINQIVKYITYLGDFGAVWLVIGFVLFLIKKTRKAGFIVMASVGIGAFINSVVLKGIFNRPRPFVVEESFEGFINSIGMFIPWSTSFPSGHAFVSFCAATILVMQLNKKWAYTYILAFIIALSRVFLCVHYVTDILVGTILGVLCGVGIHYLFNFVLDKIDKAILKRRSKNSQKTDNKNQDNNN